MPDLLLELFSEEIPARMQTQAAKDLERLAVGALSDRGLLFDGAEAFAGPRRLTLAVAGLPAKQPDVSEERKGPRVGAPEKAVEGFLRSAGVKLEQCEKRDDGKGEFYVAVIARKGRATAEVLAEVLPETIAKLPWPKSMRWRSGDPVRWVRPLHSILATFDGEVVPFEFAGVRSGNKTLGHRFLSSGDHLARSQAEVVCAGPRTDRGRGPAGGSGGTVGMAGLADRHHRGPVHGPAAGDPSDLHAHASEIFLAARG